MSDDATRKTIAVKAREYDHGPRLGYSRQRHFHPRHYPGIGKRLLAIPALEQATQTAGTAASRIALPNDAERGRIGKAV